MTPLLIRVPLTLDELKAVYTLYVYEHRASGNATKTAKLLGVSRMTVREYLERGRDLRVRLEAREDDPGLDFIRIDEAEAILRDVAEGDRYDEDVEDAAIP